MPNWSLFLFIFKEDRDSLEDDPRSGRPITAHTNANIELIRTIIKENPRATYDYVEAMTVNQFTINEIIQNALKLRKVASRWVPHELIKINRQERVETYQKNLAKFKDGTWRLCDVITEDESWFYLRQIGPKSSNACWIGEGEFPKIVVKRDRFEPKNMFYIFFKTSGAVHVSYLEKGTTMTNNYYVENCLDPVINEINKQTNFRHNKYEISSR